MVQAVNETADEVHIQQEPQEGEQTTQATGEKTDGGAVDKPEGGAQDEEEVVVSLGESPTPEEEEESRAPEWVRELRKSNREKDRKLREQEAEISRLKGAGQQPAAVVVGEKPSLEGCNFDAAKFEAELDAWKERKAKADAQASETEAKAKKEQDAWNATLQEYGSEKSELKVKDYDDAEQAVRDVLSVQQQGIVLHGVPKGRRAALIYALGKNPAELKALAAITDPIKFSFATAHVLEKKLTVTTKKAAPPPEKTVRSSVAGAAAVDNTLEKLREEARKTGDLSKVVAYNRQKRQAGRG